MTRPAAAPFHHRAPLRQPSRRRRVVPAAWLLAAALTSACDVDQARVDTFRDDGCGAGRQLGLGDLVCDYKGKPKGDHASEISVVSATCDGSDVLVCEFSSDCKWTVTSTGSCYDTCDPRPDFKATKQVRITLPNGSKQCDPPNGFINRHTCSEYRHGHSGELFAACSDNDEEVVEDPIICCVDKPPSNEPCEAEGLCNATDDGGDDDGGSSSSDTLDPTVGGPPCPFGQDLACDAQGVDGAEPDCRCVAAL